MRRAPLLVAGALSGCSLLFSSSGHVGGDGGTGDAPCSDSDGDGFTTCDGDCDDADPTRYPGAPPICESGVIENCTNDELSTLGAFLEAEELGFSVTRTELSSRPARLSLALMQGLNASPIAAVVAMTDGTTTEWYTQNLTRLGPLERGDTTHLLGASGLTPTLLSLAPAYDFDAFDVFAGLFQQEGGRFVARQLEVEGVSAIEASSVLTFTMPPTAMTTVPSSLGAEESATHLLLVPDRPLHLLAVPANPMDTTPAADLTVPTVNNIEAVLRRTTDGTVVIQSGLRPEGVAIYVRGVVTSFTDTDIVGAMAPLGTPAGGTRVLFESAAGVSISAVDCTSGTCGVTPNQIFRSPAGAEINHMSAAVLASDEDSARYAAFVGAFSLRTGGGSERAYLVFTDPAFATITDPLVLPDFARGGSILDLAIGAETEAFAFTGPSETQIHVFSVAALIERGGPTRELAVASLRACQAR